VEKNQNRRNLKKTNQQAFPSVVLYYMIIAITVHFNEPTNYLGENHMKPAIHYTVDDEDQTTTEESLTPKQILSNAGLDPAQYYLVLVQGHHQESYQNRADEKIHMHPNLKFISVFTGSTPVS
jgi:hypothetical protein